MRSFYGGLLNAARNWIMTGICQTGVAGSYDQRNSHS